MTETQLILVRHGESMGNSRDLFLGHTDLDLSEKGYKQAELLANFLKDIHFDAVYASDLKRAYNTVLPAAKQKNMEVIRDKGLREVFAGDWEGKAFDRLIEEFKEDYAKWREDIENSVCTNGESVRQLQERISKRITEIAEENSGKTVLIGTHATPVRAFCAKWGDKTRKGMKNFPWPSNASVTYVQYCDGEFVVCEYSKDDYLGDIATSLGNKV